MRTREVLTRARAMMDQDSPGVESVTALHDAVVVDISCEDHGMHALVVCDDCDTVDGRRLEDEDCDVVQAVIDVLELAA